MMMGHSAESSADADLVAVEIEGEGQLGHQLGPHSGMIPKNYKCPLGNECALDPADPSFSISCMQH
jgi:hypothetical protein